jgi:predicted Zn-dependent peptidase
LDVLIKSDKFHKIELKRRYVRKYIHKDHTIRNLLAYYLSLACEKYNTESKFNKFLGINYNLTYQVSINNVGCYSYMSLSLSCVNPKYISDNKFNLETILDAFYECIKPVIKKNKFDKKLFNRAKEMYLSNLLYALENEHKNAIDFTINTYYKGTNAMSSDGNLDELNNINIKDLYNYYLSIINDENIDYISGDIDINVVNNSNLSVKNDFLFLDKGQYEPFVVKYANTNQCYLQIVYDVKSYTNSKDFYVANIINYEFGGKSNSKLFRIIREKYGLCYHISSSYYGSRGIIMLTAAINKKDVNIIIDKIDEVFNTLIDDIDLESSKDYFKSGLLADKDKLSYLVNNHFYDTYFFDKYPSYNDNKHYDDVTIEDIKRVYNSITKELVCVYGGDSNE